MAKVQNPVIGRSKGSAGGMTFSKVYDKNVMKAKAFEVSNPNTIAQQKQRSYFKIVSALAAVFTVEQLRFLFPQRPKGISRRNGIFKQLAEFTQVVAGEKLPKLADLMSIGNAPTLDMGVTTCAISGGNINVGLDASLRANEELKDFYFCAAIVNDTQNLIVLSGDNAKVETGTLSVTLPDGWEDTDSVHAIPLITDTTEAFTSFGTLSVTKRPARI